MSSPASYMHCVDRINVPHRPSGEFTRAYNGEKLVVPLPKGVTVRDIGTLAIWSRPFQLDFSTITIPRTVFARSIRQIPQASYFPKNVTLSFDPGEEEDTIPQLTVGRSRDMQREAPECGHLVFNADEFAPQKLLGLLQGFI